MRTPHADRFTWHTSSYSGGQGGQCVEVGVTWRTSSYSGPQGGQCVEVGPGTEYVGIRDTKNREQGHMMVTPETWRAFIRSIARH